MADFLFELGVEEIPAHAVGDTLNQIKNGLMGKLTAHCVPYAGLEAAATNRRLLIYLRNIAEKSEEKQENLLGPAKRIALDEQGNPTIALQKFMEMNKLKRAEVVEIETKKGIYLGVTRMSGGQDTEAILKQIIPKVLAGLSFFKTMVWNGSRVPFIRPIRNILVLVNNQLVDVSFAGIQSTGRTFGHLLLSDAEIKVNSFKDYIEGLNKNFVIIKEDERKQKILTEIMDIEEELAGTVKLDNDMLQYYMYSNEYPVVFHGVFAEKYLSLPAEIISTFMIHEKKLLPVFDPTGKLSNNFVGVANIPDENKKVSKGNERVIQATFEDAKFFWESDLKEDFYALRQGLKNVMFQQDLGSYYEKTERIASLVDFILDETKNNHLQEPLHKAAFHCKNDLLTRMVREFPSLQGIVGGLYLRTRGESELLWKAIYGHYKPKGFVQEKLDNLGAGILSLADRMDNIAGFVAKGIKMSSSKDPYGIKRDANAVVKIILDFQLNFELDPLIRLAALNYAKNEIELQSSFKAIRELFISRVENIFKEFLNFRYDMVNAILSNSPLTISELHLKAATLAQMAEMNSLSGLITMQKRLKNIIRGFAWLEFNEKFLQEKEEHVLCDVYRELNIKIVELVLRNDYLQAASELLDLKPVVDRFFDKVMVMTPDEPLKKNRIALLQRIDELIGKVADFSLIQEEVNERGPQ